MDLQSLFAVLVPKVETSIRACSSKCMVHLEKMHGTTIRIAKLHIVDDSNDLGQSASIQILELKSTSAVTEAISFSRFETEYLPIISGSREQSIFL
jgi:hypothetical protein